MLGKHPRLHLRDLRKSLFQRLGDSPVQSLTPIAQQATIGYILHQGMLE
jgi:hypothetical protein